MTTPADKGVTRRDGLALAAAAAALAVAGPAAAADNGFEAEIAAYLSDRPVRDAEIMLNIPAEVDNGNRAPIEVFAPGAERILIVSPANPLPRIAEYRFGPLSAASRISGYIRLAASQDVIALALFPDGSAARTQTAVKVLVGGCGAPETG